ncbi:MAG: hypothetical protein KJ000_31430 [Pirellulaceae bacterium]|nr:hypothetical protein [Pirellulaceae bacterium]
MSIARFLVGGWLATICLGACIASAETPRSGRLSFGWASASITPEQPVAIGGQYHTRISGQVHDPLTATALAIETSDDHGVIDQTVFVSCDLSLVRGQTQQRVRELVQRRAPDLDVNKIVISATHTHTAPALTDADETDLHPYDFIGSWAYRIPAEQSGVMRPAQYLAFLEQRLSEVVVNAWKARRPGSMSFALSHASIARNRRAVYADGTARMYGNTSDPGFSHLEGVSDDSVDVLFFWRDRGQPEGMIVNVYCPAQEVEGETYLSADFWYDARTRLREKYHADLQILPWVGASGDQSPHLLWNQQAEAALRQQRKLSPREEIARRIVRAVDDAYETVHGSDAFAELSFEHRVERVPLPVWQVSDERYAQSLAIFEAGKHNTDQLSSPDYINWRVSRTMVARYEHQKQDPHFRAELHLLRLGPLAVVTNPFELYADFGLRIKARSPAVQTCVVQLTADCAGYLPTERAVQGGGYSARIDDGVVGPEGGNVLVDRTVSVLQQMFSP